MFDNGHLPATLTFPPEGEFLQLLSKSKLLIKTRSSRPIYPASTIPDSL